MPQVFATVVDLAIYKCTDPVQVQTPGTTCFKMMAVGAPAEWLVSTLWINYMLNMAYDFYTTPQISAVVKAAYNAGDSPDTHELRKNGWSPRAEDFELDEATLLAKAEYPAKAWGPPSPTESQCESMSLHRPTVVRGFIW